MRNARCVWPFSIGAPHQGEKQWGSILGNGDVKAILKRGFVVVLQAVVDGRVAGYISCSPFPRGKKGEVVLVASAHIN